MARETAKKNGKTSTNVKELYALFRPLNANLLCKQLSNLMDAIDEKRPGLSNRRVILFHPDNSI